MPLDRKGGSLKNIKNISQIATQRNMEVEMLWNWVKLLALKKLWSHHGVKLNHPKQQEVTGLEVG